MYMKDAQIVLYNTKKGKDYIDNYDNDYYGEKISLMLYIDENIVRIIGDIDDWVRMVNHQYEMDNYGILNIGKTDLIDLIKRGYIQIGLVKIC